MTSDIFTRFEMQTDDARKALPQLRKAIEEMDLSGRESDGLQELLSALQDGLGA